MSPGDPHHQEDDNDDSDLDLIIRQSMEEMNQNEDVIKRLCHEIKHADELGLIQIEVEVRGNQLERRRDQRAALLTRMIQRALEITRS